MDKKAIYEKKKLFVETQLQRLVKTVDPNVLGLIYRSTDVQEIVEIHWITGKKVVDVTGDSLKAIAVDVLRKIG